MEAYTDFAYVYDTLMDNTPYEKWCEQVTAILQRHGIKEDLVLDLGCGTGTLTELLAKKGYDVKDFEATDTHHASCGDHEHAKDEKHTKEHKHSHEHNHNHNHAH